MSEPSLQRPSAFLPAAGWVPWPDRSQVRLTGADRAKFLHNFCTNDIKKLQPGEGCEAFLTSIKGRILGHLLVFAGESELTIDTVPGEDVKIRDHLDRYLITEDVQIEVTTAQFRCRYLFGPDWPRLLKQRIGVDLAGLQPYQHVHHEPTGLTFRRMDQTAAAGFEALAPAEGADALASLCQAGDGPALPQQISLEAFDAFRVDAGFPTYGVDLSSDHLAQEAARTDKAISFTKGCYLGQEPIARIDALGHVNRELRVVVLESRQVPPLPAMVINAATKAELGPLTSVGQVGESATVGLGMLRTSATPGTAIVVASSQGGLAGQVVQPSAQPNSGSPAPSATH